MLRKIIKIDSEKCNGCGLCINSCHEGALQLIDGKAKLISDSYCDGLGACLPACPMDAIKIEERDAAEFDEEAVSKRMGMATQATNAATPAEPSVQAAPAKLAPLACGCPGMMAKKIERNDQSNDDKSGANNHQNPHSAQFAKATPEVRLKSRLSQWPCQIKLVNPSAPYFNNAHLLVAADCTAFAYANIHEDFIKNKVTIIGCPKLDNTEYSEKLAEILRLNEIKSITVLRMEVPCCGGMTTAVKQALINSQKMIPWNVVTIGISGEIIEE